MKNKLHISQVTHKTAQILAHIDMVDDRYHNNIKNTAKAILDNPCAGNSWSYVAQYASGNCIWEFLGKSVIVNSETGQVSKFNSI